MAQVIGIDIGGTYIKGGVVQGSRVLKELRVDARADEGTEVFVDAILGIITSLRKGRKIKAIGVASPGAVDTKRGIIIDAPNTPQKNFPLQGVIRKAHKLPVTIDNDANCFTLAEALVGAGKNYGIVAGITLGTGVGGGLVINKKIYHGRGSAGEFGHITLDYNGWEGPKGNRGGLEEYVGSRGVMRMGRLVSAMSPLHLSQLAQKGSGDAREVWQKFGQLLGFGVANVVYAVDPEVVVIGGQVSKSWKFFSADLKDTLRRQCFFSPPPVVKAAMPNAGVVGAALLC